jgi:hypothetical protein
MFFMFPGINLYVPCGIILDTRRVWSLITLMTIIDADTNNRNLCVNESGSPILMLNPHGNSDIDNCTRSNLAAKFGKDSKYLTLNYAVFIPSKESFDKCSATCHDQRCKYLNSGGSINQWVLSTCKFSDPECYSFEEVDSSSVPAEIAKQVGEVAGFLVQRTSCSLCTKPYLCVFQDYTQTEKYKTVVEEDRIANYIGPAGEGFLDLFNPGSRDKLDIGNIAISQCRFEKKDWDLWIGVLKDWYREILNVLAQSDEANNYIFANPFKPSYFENEINLYINPDRTTREALDQNKIFQDSIIGFYYTDVSCEEQLAPLNGVKTETYGVPFSNAVDRCDEFWKLDDATMTTEKRRAWEATKRVEIKELVHKVADMFNKKHGRKVPVYRSRANSNAFPNAVSLGDALAGAVNIEDFLEESDKN